MQCNTIFIVKIENIFGNSLKKKRTQNISSKNLIVLLEEIHQMVENDFNAHLR